MNENYRLKKSIAYSRDYRKLKTCYPLFLIIIVVSVTFYLFNYDKITHFVCYYALNILKAITGKNGDILSSPYIPCFGPIYYIKFTGNAPSFTMSLISLFITMLAIVFAAQVKNNNKPLMIFITIGLLVQFISSVYFIFLPNYFPYNLTDYSILYIKQQAALWIIIPVVFYIGISLSNSMVISKIISLFVLILVCFIYGVVRYIVYMAILSCFSYLFMASLFFTFGVLFDFLQMVAIYSVFQESASYKFGAQKGNYLWSWS